jgi:hypothetical protein
MQIRRDNIGRLPPSSQSMAAAVARGAYSPEPFPPLMTISNGTFPANRPIPIDSASTAASTSPNKSYVLNPLQQREAMQLETYERERNSLIKKATNSQGDSVARFMAAYLKV